MTGNLLVVVGLASKLRYYEFLILINRRAPVLNHKSCWLDGSHVFPNLCGHEKEAEKKFLGTISIFFIF